MSRQFKRLRKDIQNKSNELARAQARLDDAKEKLKELGCASLKEAKALLKAKVAEEEQLEEQLEEELAELEEELAE